MLAPGERDEDEFIELVNKYKDNPYICGYLIKDEPRYEELDELRTFYSRIKDIDPNKLIDINLAGSDNPYYIAPLTSLTQYLNYFQSLFHPALWSYDFYPIKEINGEIIVYDEIFFKVMQDFYKMSQSTFRPFWAYCMSMPYIAENYSRPTPTIGELRFEAFSALAYGAQGIVYWTYAQREDNKKERYLSAPIDINGNKTPIWYSVKTINNEIKSLNNVFCNCEVMDVMHAGKIYPGTEAFSAEKFGYLRELITMESGVLISHLVNNSNHYIVIVNHNPLHTQKISMVFMNPSKIKVYELPDMDQPFIKPDGTHSRTLGSGGYVVFQIIK